MKKALRAAMLTVVLFVGANAQAVRTEVTEPEQAATGVSGGECYYINGVWTCIG